MNIQQMIGLLLLIFMIVTSYALFGGVAHEKTPIPVKVNLSDVNETNIQEYHYYTVEEQVTMDATWIAVMLILIGITSVGSVANADNGKDTDTKEEL